MGDQGQPVLPAKQPLKTEAREHMGICVVMSSESCIWRLNNPVELRACQFKIAGENNVLPVVAVYQYNSVTIRQVFLKALTLLTICQEISSETVFCQNRQMHLVLIHMS